MQFLKQAMILAGAALLALPSAAQIRPAGYTDGFVRQVDPRARTLTVGNETYQVNRNTTTSIYEVHPGDEVKLTYVVTGGRWVALDVQKTGRRQGITLFNGNFGSY